MEVILTLAEIASFRVLIYIYLFRFRHDQSKILYFARITNSVRRIFNTTEKFWKFYWWYWYSDIDGSNDSSVSILKKNI